MLFRSQAILNERNRKAAIAAEASRKRSISALSEEAIEAKRQKTDNGSSVSVSSVLANFDFSILPHSLITELIISNLQVLTEQSLTNAINVNALYIPNITYSPMETFSGL